MMFSKNFSYEELTRSSTASKRGINNTPGVDLHFETSQKPTCSGQIVIRNLQSLCDTILQPIRDRFGKPIIVASGYRCPQLNKAVGGVRNSDHMYGCAADIKTKEDTPKANKELFDLIVSMIKSGEIEVKQCLDEYNYDWIHISYQDGRTCKRNQVLHIK